MLIKRKSKRLKIRKKRIWTAVLMFLLMTAMLAAAMLITVSSFISYIVDNKVNEQLEMMQIMQSDYVENRSTGFADKYGIDCFITNTEGEEIFVYGRNTCDMSAPAALETAAMYRNEYTIYPDKDSNVLTPDGEGSLTFEIGKFLKEAEKYLKANESVSLFTTGYGSDDESVDPYIRLPVWISTELFGGGKLFVKSMVTVNINYLMAFLRIVAIVAIIYLVIFVLMIINVISNISVRNKLMKQFLRDVVTGGNNRVFYFSKGEPTVRKRFNAKKTYAVLSIQFVKYLNFCICHSIDEGDKMLCAVYDVLRSQLSRREIAAHFDSAEFAALLEITGEQELRERTEKLLALLETINPDHKLSFHIGSFIIGVVTDDNGKPVRRKTLDLEECYNNARTAREVLLDSDASGTAMFDEKLIEEQRWTDTVTEHQKAALENEEFTVYYQPKYDPRTDELRGAEALIRWQSPEFGFVTPNRFIPIFEDNGFITEIDHYMLAHAARDQKRWLDAGLNCVPVSVNVSRAHFIEEDLAEQIRDIIDAEGTPHGLIEIELTESAFFDDKKMMLETVKRLKEYGFTVSMDDFGSGYSSLNSLKDMPLDVLKLDAEFFRGESEDGRDRIVVAEAIRLARNLNMRTVAEGVEVREQVDFLAEQECDMIQGYYYAKPMPRDDFEKRLSGKTDREG